MPLLPVADDRIMLKHGAGGRAMHRLIHDAILGAFHADVETPGEHAGDDVQSLLVDLHSAALGLGRDLDREREPLAVPAGLEAVGLSE